MSGKPVAHVGSAVVKSTVVSGSGSVFVGDLGSGIADTSVSCAPTTGSPVNPILGCKLLPAEVDFALPAPSVFSFARSYNSGDAREGPLGMGWSIPGTSVSLECSDAATVVLDAEGRRISFEVMLPGEELFSPTERLWIRRGGPSSAVQAPWTGRWAAVPAALQQDADAMLVHGGGGYLCFEPVHALEAGCLLPPGGTQQAWRLAADIDAAGYTTRYQWSAEHRLLKGVTDSAGRHYALAYVRIPQGARAQPDLLRLEGVVLAAGGVPHSPVSAPGDQADWLVRYRYDGAGNLVAVHNRIGQVVRHFSWTPEHLMAGHGQPGGIDVAYRWAHATLPGATPLPGRSARVVEQAEADGLKRQFAYLDDRTMVRDSLGRVETYHFKGTGGLKRWTGHTRADGSQLLFEYDGFGRLISSTDGLGRRTDTRLDGQGRTVGSAGPDGSSWRINLDEHTGLPLKLEDPEGRITTIERDARGNAVRVRSPDGQDMRYRYEHAGLPDRPSHVTDVLGKTKTLAYNRLGQLTRYTDCSGHSQHWDYDDEGRLLRSTDALGHATRLNYDALGRPILQTLPDGATVKTDYDPLGRPVEVLTCGAAMPEDDNHTSPPLQRTQRYQWDRFGRLTQATNPAGHTQKMQYDAAGRLVVLHNENGAQTTFGYDLLDRMTQETGFDGRVQAYRYNAGGELVEKIERMTAGARSTRYAYYKAGRLRERHWPDVQAPTASPAWHVDTFKWTKTGELLEANSADVKVAFEYDRAGQLVFETQTHADGWCYRVQHRHDLLGQEYGVTLGSLPELRWLTYGPGHVHGLRWTPDPNGPELVMDFERDALHREVTRSVSDVPGGFERQMSFDAAGRVLEVQTQFSGAAASANAPPQAPAAGYSTARHGYDGLGQLVTIDEWQRAASPPSTAPNVRVGPMQQSSQVRYAYDLSARLVGSQRIEADQAAGVRNRYRFDPAGNRLSLVAGSVSRHGAVVADNRVAELDGHRCRYDEAGNMVEKWRGDGVRLVMRYDGLHRMAGLDRTDADGGERIQASYIYDALMRRVVKRVTQGAFAINDAATRVGVESLALATRFGWDEGRIVFDEAAGQVGDGHGEVTKARSTLYEPGSYVPLGRVETEMGCDAPEMAEVTAGTIQFAGHAFAAAGVRQTADDNASGAQTLRFSLFHVDHLGTPQRLVSAEGRTIWAAEQDDWAAAKLVCGNFDQAIRFQGQWVDRESGLHYNWNRYYDADFGAYTQSDPIGLAGGVNTYSYVGGNPVSYVDPLGLDRWGAEGGRGIVYTQMDLGRTVYYDAFSGDSFVFSSRNRVASSSKPGAADPYSGLVTYCERGRLARAYGTAKMRTTDSRSRWIHGGGSGLSDPWAPQQGWKPTEGCTRAQNEDVNNLCSEIDVFRSRYPNGVLLYRRD